MEKIEQFYEGETEPFAVNTFQYDDQLRVSKEIETVVYSGSDIVADITYPDKATISVVHHENTPASNLSKPTLHTIKLDVNSRISSMEQKRFFQSGISDTLKEFAFVYNNAAQQLNSQTSFFANVATTWQADNVKKIAYYREATDAVPTITQEFEHGDVKNTVYPDLNFYLTGFALHAGTKYLFTEKLGLKSATYVTVARFFLENEEDNISHFAYQFDDKKRPVVITATFKGKDTPVKKIIHKVYYQN